MADSLPTLSDRAIRDGHKLVMTLGPHYSLYLDVICPGCDHWHADHAEERRAEPCWVRYLVREVGSEFLEWWTEGGPESVTLDGPIEFEWWVDGGDEPEVWWRPVEGGESS